MLWVIGIVCKGYLIVKVDVPNVIIGLNTKKVTTRDAIMILQASRANKNFIINQMNDMNFLELKWSLE
jgi:hypothetical protein